MHFRVIAVSGPRGAGKGTVIEALIAQVPGLRRIVPHTTRAARWYEANGREYHFVSPAEFEGMRLAGRFAWWGQIGPTQRAGTVHEEMTPCANGSVIDVLPAGAFALRERVIAQGGSALLLAVVASVAERHERIHLRQPDTPDDEVRRLMLEDPSFSFEADYASFDRVIANVGDDASVACRQAVLAARRFLGLET